MSLVFFGALVSWASIRADPQAYVPYGFDPLRPQYSGWALGSSLAPRPSPVGPGAIYRASENVVLPKRGAECSPAAGWSVVP